MKGGVLAKIAAELATAGLVQRLQTVVAQASPGNRSCAITNRSPLDDAHPGRFPRVTVQVRLRCGAGEMAAVLRERSPSRSMIATLAAPASFLSEA